MKDLEQKRIENGNDSETEEKILVTPTEEALEDLLSIIPQESLKKPVNMKTNMTLFDPYFQRLKTYESEIISHKI